MGRVIQIGAKKTGDGCPAFIIAEVGLNHNGDFDLAKKSVEAAARCGVDAVKFQNFKTEDFLTDRSIYYTYKSQGNIVREPFFDLCKRSELKSEWIGPLKELCDGLGIIFFSTPTTEEGTLDLVKAGVKILKNGSDYLTHIPLITFMGKTGLPVLLSTGMAYKDDIDIAVETLKQTGNSQIIVLHCVSTYPTEDKDINLKRMLALRDRYNFLVGFSDHSQGWEAATQAFAMGACAIEKHFTLDKNLPGPDHWFSANPDEMGILVKKIRSAELRLGTAHIEPAEGEMASRDEMRLGLVAARDLEKGQMLTTHDCVFRKPCKGLLPRDMEEYIGRYLSVSVKAGESLMAEHFQEPLGSKRRGL